VLIAVLSHGHPLSHISKPPKLAALRRALAELRQSEKEFSATFTAADSNI